MSRKVIKIHQSLCYLQKPQTPIRSREMLRAINASTFIVRNPAVISREGELNKKQKSNFRLEFQNLQFYKARNISRLQKKRISNEFVILKNKLQDFKEINIRMSSQMYIVVYFAILLSIYMKSWFFSLFVRLNRLGGGPNFLWQRS